MHAIYKREIKNYFNSAIGYVIISTFVFFASIFFSMYNLSDDTSSMTSVFSNLLLIFVFIIPILTMRTFSEEKRQKTDQALLTAPVSLFGIVIGKFLAAFTIFVLGLSCTAIFGVILGGCSTVEGWVIVGSIIGMLFVGAALIAVCLFISNLTESQVVAAIAGIFVILFLYLVGNFAAIIPNPILQAILSNISINTHFANFSLGIFSLSDTVFYLSMAVLFIFFTVRMLEKRRWS